MTLKEMFKSYADSIRSHTGLHYVPSFNDMNTSSNDDMEEVELHKDQPITPTVNTTSIESPSRSSNKEDASWPSFDTQDIHRVNVSDHTRNKRHIMDTGTKPSVWEYIIKSDKLKSNDFKSIDRNNDGKITAEELATSLKITKSDADRMIAEGDRNKDKALDREEYTSILAHYGSE